MAVEELVEGRNMSPSGSPAVSRTMSTVNAAPATLLPLRRAASHSKRRDAFGNHRDDAGRNYEVLPLRAMRRAAFR